MKCLLTPSTHFERFDGFSYNHTHTHTHTRGLTSTHTNTSTRGSSVERVLLFAYFVHSNFRASVLKGPHPVLEGTEYYACDVLLSNNEVSFEEVLH
jgi:hypothetical protein